MKNLTELLLLKTETKTPGYQKLKKNKIIFLLLQITKNWLFELFITLKMFYGLMVKFNFTLFRVRIKSRRFIKIKGCFTIQEKSINRNKVNSLFLDFSGFKDVFRSYT